MPPTCMPVAPLAVLAMGPVVMSPLLAHFTAAEVPPMVVPVICPTIPASMTSTPAGSSASNEIETLLVTLSRSDSVANAAMPAMAVPAPAVPRMVCLSPLTPTVRFRTVA